MSQAVLDFQSDVDKHNTSELARGSPTTDVRTIRYQEIAHVLRERIAAVGAGHVLPSESDLSAEFGVSRVTVRRALETLRETSASSSRGKASVGSPRLLRCSSA